MSNKKEILLKIYDAIFRPILAKEKWKEREEKRKEREEKRKEREEKIQKNYNSDLAA